jgi:hypothetical protein
VRNEDVLHRVKEERNILHTINRRKGNLIGHILCRNCFLKHAIEGNLEGRIEMTGRRGRRRKQLLDDLKEKRRYLKLKEKALDRSLWRTRFGRGYGPVVRQTTECLNECMHLPMRCRNKLPLCFNMGVLFVIAEPRNFTNFLLHRCPIAEVMYLLYSVIFSTKTRG